jgi:hypothetical protein
MRRRVEIHRPEDVRAILGGTKRAMRSLVRPRLVQATGDMGATFALPGDWFYARPNQPDLVIGDPRTSADLLSLAPWRVDDLLLVKEPWSVVDEYIRGLSEDAPRRRVAAYRASWNPEVTPAPEWRPASTCPDWAVRIHLRALAVEVGRIQDPGPWPPGPPTRTVENGREMAVWEANAWVWVLRFEVAKAPGQAPGHVPNSTAG